MYSIGQFAKRTGLTARALRFYESKGLIQARRTSGNQYRYYTEEDVDCALRIRFFKALGFTLEEIQKLLSLLDSRETVSHLEAAFQAQLLQCQHAQTELQNRARLLEHVLTLLSQLDAISFEHLQRELDTQERLAMLQALQFEHAHLSTIGQRSTNDDTTLVRSTEHGHIYAIGDGMGEGEAGAAASKTACAYIANHLDFAQLTPQEHQRHLTQLLHDANAAVYEHSEPTAATTLTFLAIKDNHAYIGHVGDTRVYRYDNLQLTQLTRDHSRIQQLLDAGEILHKDIPSHPERHILYAAVGHKPEPPTVFVHAEPIPPSKGAYLLCTDGLTNVLSDSEIAREIQRAPDLDTATQRLIALAREHGEDNASVIGVDVHLKA